LRDVRARVNELWTRLAAHNRQHPIADADKIKVTFYMGQNIEQPEPEPPLGAPLADEPGPTPALQAPPDAHGEGEDE
jgi:hypothetical protein